MIARVLLMSLWCFRLVSAADLDAIKQEPDLIKRYEKALELAMTESKTARKLIQEGGSRSELFVSLNTISEATELSLQSLRDTGKKPSKLTKQYKRGELNTRELIRELNDVVVALSMEDRPKAETARDRVTLTHEEYLLGVMTGK